MKLGEQAGVHRNGWAPTVEASARIWQRESGWRAGVRLRAQRRVQWLRLLWAGDEARMQALLAVSHGEVDRILAEPAIVAQAEAHFYATDSIAIELGHMIDEADKRTLEDERWAHVCRAFDLSVEEAQLLALVAAVEADSALRRVCAYLHDDLALDRPTLALASQLFQWNVDAVPRVEGALRAWRIVRAADGTAAWSAQTPLQVDAAFTGWLLHGQLLDEGLPGAVELVTRAQAEALPCLYAQQRAEIFDFARALTAPNYPPDRAPTVLVELVGAHGSGKRTLAAQAATLLGHDLLAVDARRLLETLSSSDAVLRVTRVAHLHNFLVYWYNTEDVDGSWWDSPPKCKVIFAGSTTRRAFPQAAMAVRSFALPPLTRAARIGLWTHLTDHDVPASVADWQLMPGEIAQAARLAPAGAQAVAEGSRLLLHNTHAELLSPLPCPYTWDDLVLAPSVREHLEELQTQARLRWQVYEEWGFHRLTPLGTGLTALFAGPSGTGKTMAAQVLARALGIDLYRVDLAGVINKYIGETEKRLKQVFDACERAHVLLFFDEADALFGQRTQVKDAHDRFANIEIDYLLQRMEQFDGIAILATNRKNDIDRAFVRRLRFIIDFLAPGPAERLALWRQALPEKAPDGTPLCEDIQWESLANKLTLTGAGIKSAVLTAAFQARADGSRIRMSHLLRAAQRELAKHGGVVRAGDWEEG